MKVGFTRVARYMLLQLMLINIILFMASHIFSSCQFYFLSTEKWPVCLIPCDIFPLLFYHQLACFLCFLFRSAPTLNRSNWKSNSDFTYHGSFIILTKQASFLPFQGAPETIQERLVDLPPSYVETYKKYTRQGSRVLALAFKSLPEMTVRILFHVILFPLCFSSLLFNWKCSYGNFSSFVHLVSVNLFLFYFIL